MHGRGAPASDPCSFSREDDLIATGDAFLRDTVGKIMSSSAWTGNSVIFVTWDESDFPFNDTSGCCDAVPGGGHVVTLVISHSDHTPRTSDAAYNHYSMLATIEGGWKLGCLAFTCDTANVTRIGTLSGLQGCNPTAGLYAGCCREASAVNRQRTRTLRRDAFHRGSRP